MAELTRGQLLKNPEILGATTSGAKIIFYDGDETNTVSLKAPDAISGDFTLTLPTTVGNANEYLKTDGSGNLSWSSITLGVSSVTAGTDTTVSTSTGAVTVWNTSTLQSITGRGASTNQAISITNTTAATATNTGALIVTGGVGIGGSLYVGGTIDGTATTATAAATAYSLANTSTTYVGRSALADSATNVSVGSATQVIYKNASNITTGSSSLIFDETILKTPQLHSTNSQGDEGGEILLAKPATNSTIAGTGVTVDIWQNRLRFFEQGGTARGYYLDITAGDAGVGTNLLGGGGSVTSLTAGTDTAISGSTGAITIWNNSTLQTVTSRGASTDQLVSLTNVTSSTTTNTGALQVFGGVGIGSNLIAGGYGRFNGAFDEVASTTTVGLYVGVAGSAPASPRVAFANSGTTWQIDNYNGNFRWYIPGTTRMQIDTNGTLSIYANVNATSTTTGALVVTGGAGIGSNLYVGGTIYGTVTTSTTSTSAATAYSLANTGTTYVGRAVLADSATTSTSAATAYSLANTGTTYVGRAVLADSATTSTSAATAYSLANTGTTYVGRAVLADSATALQTARTINGVSFNGTSNITVSATTTNALTIGTGLSGTSFNGSSPVTIAIDSSVVTLTGAQTLTNKTLTSPVIGTDFAVIGAGVTGYTPFTNNIGYAVVDTNNYNMIYSHNLNSGSDASSDFVAYNNLADISSYFIDMGINSSNYSSVSYPIFSANSGYIFTGGGAGQGSELYLGTGSTSSDLILFTGGTTVANKRLVIKSETGNVLIGSTTDDVTNKLQVTGTTKFNGDINVAGAAYATADITGALQLVTKQYVDNATSAGLHIHTPVRVETAGNLNATYTTGGSAATVTAITATSYLTITGHGITELHDMFVFTSTANGIVSGTPYYVSEIVDVNTLRFSLTHAGVTYTAFTNGTGLSIAGRSNAGVGATLTNAGTQTNLVVDGVTLFINDRVLVDEQTNAFENGVYVVTNTGTVSTNWILTRSDDANKYGPTDTTQLGGGDYFYVSEGTLAAGESLICTNTEPIVYGTSAINFTLFSAAPSFVGVAPINVSGQNISLTGTVDATHGGTGVSTVTTGDLLYGSAANTWSKLPLGVAYKSLVVNASGTQLEWNAVALNQSAAISGELGIVNGGTGASTSATARTNLGLAIGTDIPSVLGSGATGTWSINIIGSAGSATTATSAATAYALANTSTTFVGRAALATSATNIVAGTVGQLVFQSAANTTAFAGPGTAGQILVSAGAIASGPVYTSTGSIYVSRAVLADTASTATNIAGGATGSIPYQTAAGSTNFIAIGTNGFVLQSNGTTATWVSTSSLGISGGGGGTVGSPFAGIFTITNTSSSISTTTGALQVTGGTGIGGNLYVGGSVVGGGVRTTSSTSAPTNPTVGDIWYDTANDVVYRYTNDGTTSYWIDITGPFVASAIDLVTTSSTQTLTNKRITPRVNNNGATTTGTLTPNGDTTDQYEALGLTGTVTFAAPSGTPTAGQKLMMRIKDNGTSRTLNWTTTSGGYRIIGTTLPTATTASKNTYVGSVYNATDAFWDVVAVTTEV